MIDSKFIRLYQCLDKALKKDLQKWVKSPVYNQHNDVRNLFDYLYSRTVISQTTVDKNRVYRHLFPKQKYNDSKLRHIQSYALNVLKEFVGYKQVFLNDFEAKKGQLQAFGRWQLPKLSQQALKKAKKSLAQSTTRNGKYHYNSFELEVERFKLGSTQKRTTKNNLPQVFDHLSTFFVITTLKYACTARSHSSVYKKNYEIPMLDAVLDYAQQQLEVPVVAIYYNAYSALTQPSETTHYQKLKSHFFEHLDELAEDEQYEVFQLTLNYCIKQINMGDESYFKEIFELYQKGLSSKILLVQGELSRFTYKNIVSTGLKLEAFDWIDEFIVQYTAYLPLAFRQNYQDYGRAKWLFVQGEYDLALQKLLEVAEYDDLFLILDAKMMLLKIYYEQQSFDALESLIASFRVFLQRKEVMSYHKEVYKNVLRFIERIISLTPRDEAMRKKLASDIKQKEPLTERQWLLEKLNML